MRYAEDDARQQGKHFQLIEKYNVLLDKYFPEVGYTHVAGGAGYTQGDVCHAQREYREDEQEYPAGFDPLFKK